LGHRVSGPAQQRLLSGEAFRSEERDTLSEAGRIAG